MISPTLYDIAGGLANNCDPHNTHVKYHHSSSNDNVQPPTPDSELSVPLTNNNYDNDDSINSSGTGNHVYHDVLWSVLFVLQILAVIVVAIIYIPQIPHDDDNDDDPFHDDMFDVFLAFTPFYVVSVMWSLFLISVATRLVQTDHNADRLIRASILFNICSVVFCVTMSIILVHWLIVILEVPMFMILLVIFWIVVLIVLLIFTCHVWKRIPFTTVLMDISIVAIRDNFGLLSLYAYTSLILRCIWLLFWSKTVSALMSVGLSAGSRVFLMVLMAINLYWTTTVLANIVHVTTCGITGTFLCVAPSEGVNSRCDTISPFQKSLTTSFGSICKGSLLIGIVRPLYNSLYFFRKCFRGIVASCINYCLKRIEPINRWAYVSIGLRDYSFMEGGVHATTVLHKFGYTTHVADVVDHVVFMVDLAVGFLSASYFIASFLFFSWDPTTNPTMVWFDSVVPFIICAVVSMTFFSMIGDAVKTVILYYLEAPNEFQKNHPQLFERLNDAWHHEYSN